MQIISRRVHEAVVIGEETEIEVLEIDKKQKCVRLRIRQMSDRHRFHDVTLSPQKNDDDNGDIECKSEYFDNLDDSRELTIQFS